MKANNKELENYIKGKAECMGLKRTEFLKLLIDFYELKHIDLLIKRIKQKNQVMDIGPADKAALEILKEYLEVIL
jgi:hypothetical protein